tara:strand:- start:301 stop:573 length:273 start_codon:yes stop_codon:yes gene_type:complete
VQFIHFEEDLLMSDIKVYGTTWCGDCTRAKQFMDENGVSYNWTDVDEETQYQDYIKGLNNGQMRVPTIIFPDGSILVEPSNEELAEKIPV